MPHPRAFFFCAVFLAVLFASPLVLGVDPTQLPDPVLQARYQALTHELRCMKCQNQSIADSPVALASDLRREVRQMLLAGKSDAEIREFMVARYGDFILFRPQLAARTLWLWLAPFVFLLIAAIVAVRVLRQRARLLPTDDTPIDGEESPLPQRNFRAE